MKAILQNKTFIENDPVYDVIISGAGPVGLFLACELALANCSVLILEKTENPSSVLKKLPFGIRGLSSPTIEALYRRNLFNELEIHKELKNPHSNAVQGPRRQAGHFAGIPFHDGHIDSSIWKYRLPSSTEPSLISEMEELESVLTRRAGALGVTIKRGLAVNDFAQDTERVIVHSDRQSFKAKWLVGCDGSRSIIRKKGGFEFAGTEPEFTGYSLKIDLSDPEKLKPGRNLTSKGMYLVSRPGYLAVQDFDGGKFHDSKEPLSLEHIQELLRRISDTDVTITAVDMAASWTDRARQATSYRKGRVLLAGDAAHIHSPLGGQGLNLGLGDAMNLGWKLAATLQNRAPEGLLESYFTERHPIGEQVLDWSRAQVAIMKPDPDSRALNAIVRDLMDTKDGATYMAERVWGVSMHYNIDGDHALAGYSVPNFEFPDGTGINEFMYDGQGVLLDFEGNHSIALLAKRYSGSVRYISGAVKDSLGLSAVLVRPDGIVAWASDKGPDCNAFQKAADRWFLRS